jgi:hypothetical protein
LVSLLEPPTKVAEAAVVELSLVLLVLATVLRTLVVAVSAGLPQATKMVRLATQALSM